MRQITCDACGQTLTVERDQLFTWNISANPIVAPSGDATDVLDLDPDLDSVEEMDAMLIERVTDHDTVEMLPVCIKRHYEVCGGCYSRLIADPLGLESRRSRPFSRN